MQILHKNIFMMIFAFFKNQSALAIENLALRQQLHIYHHSRKRPKIRLRDRLFWILISRLWNELKNSLIVVKSETVIGWHRKGFKLFWAWKSRKKRPGRPSIPLKVRNLIKQMARENPTWGAPTIQGSLLKLGFKLDGVVKTPIYFALVIGQTFDILHVLLQAWPITKSCIWALFLSHLNTFYENIKLDETTVSNYLKKSRPGKPPSQKWRIFLKNHMHNTFAIDFFTVPTATFRVLYVFIILLHENRKVVHFNVIAKWTARQIVEACPWDTTPKT